MDGNFHYVFVSENPRYETAYACENKLLKIECREGEVIKLIRANYGRFSITICNDQGNTDWSVNCMSTKSFEVLYRRWDINTTTNYTYPEAPAKHNKIKLIRARGRVEGEEGHLKTNNDFLNLNWTDTEWRTRRSRRNNERRQVKTNFSDMAAVTKVIVKLVEWRGKGVSKERVREGSRRGGSWRKRSRQSPLSKTHYASDITFDNLIFLYPRIDLKLNPQIPPPNKIMMKFLCVLHKLLGAQTTSIHHSHSPSVSRKHQRPTFPIKTQYH